MKDTGTCLDSICRVSGFASDLSIKMLCTLRLLGVHPGSGFVSYSGHLLLTAGNHQCFAVAPYGAKFHFKNILSGKQGVLVEIIVMFRCSTYLPYENSPQYDKTSINYFLHDFSILLFSRTNCHLLIILDKTACQQHFRKQFLLYC